ncbi:hypothetical protein LC593_23535 [Nostoc sp. CHAB 5844]|nr:hypothetical protein [Nostoc sp. CHAB 5844]
MDRPLQLSRVLNRCYAPLEAIALLVALNNGLNIWGNIRQKIVALGFALANTQPPAPAKQLHPKNDGLSEISVLLITYLSHFSISDCIFRLSLSFCFNL